MAVDTRQKRMSMLSLGGGEHLHVLFEADSSVDLDDRQHLLGCYSGIAFGAAVSQIDTRAKRFSMMNVWDGTHIIVTQEADGSVGAADRATLLDCYGGNAFAAPSAAGVVPRLALLGVGI